LSIFDPFVFFAPLPFKIAPSGAIPPTLRTTALEGLNSSLAQSAAELWMAKIWPEMANYTFCVIFYFCQKCFFAVILAPDMLENQSRTLKTRIIA